MDYLMLSYVVVGVAGFGGGGLVAAGDSLVGYKPNPDDNYPPKKKCPGCPPILGLLLAEILWLVINPAVEMSVGLLTAGAVGLAAGAAGGTLSNLVMRR